MKSIVFALALAAALANGFPVPATVEASSQPNHLVERATPPHSFVGDVKGVCHTLSTAQFEMLTVH